MAESLWTGRHQVLRFDAGIHYPEPGAYSTLRFASNRSGDLSDAREMELSELEFFGTAFASRVTKVAVEEGNSGILLEWTSVQDVTYAVDGSENLNDWQPIATGIPAAGALTRFTDASPGGLPKSRFYRVRKED